MKNTMDRQTPLNLTRILNRGCKDERSSPESAGMITEENYLIEDELWGINKECYVPIGYLELPVTTRQDDAYSGLPYKYNLGLFTAFTDSFLEEGLVLPKPIYDKNSSDLFAYSKGKKDKTWQEGTVINLNEPIILESGDIKSEGLNLRPADVVKQHLQNFFKLYEQARKSEATSEAVRCILRCFTPYEKVER